ncbi:hypothetical protein KI387_006051 [Taxus chinensis]|uniref:Pentatricopeptide repeat-containing protein n=1 Tax=Taxus chinensis TaxID=29808 RepID=A0AA38GP89_TAXCH|nr:hypothetical protein KI387_006051 [Taxus chinensis]
MFTSPSESQSIEQLCDVLLKKGSAPNIERALGKINFQLKSSCVEKVLLRCAGNKILGLRFFIWAVQQPPFKPTYFLYKTACRVLGVIQEPAMLIQVLADMRKEGRVVSIKTFRILINLCKEGRLLEEALELLDHMKDLTCTPDIPIYNTVIHLLCESRRMDMAKVIFYQMLELGVSPDVITYSTLIKGFANVGQLEDAQMLFDEMREHGCFPSIVTYTILLNSYCKAGCPEKGLELLDEMFQKQYAPNVVTYTALIQSFCKAGRIKEALELFDRMITCGCSPNTVTYNILVNALCMEGKLDDADKLMEKMIKGGHLPKDQCHNSFMIELLRANKVEEAENLLRNMLVSGISPNGLAYNTLIKVLCLVGRYSNALDWYHKMENMYCSLELEVCSILLRGLCHHGYEDEVENVLEGMVEKGILLEISTFDAIIRHLNKAGRHEKALNLSNKLRCQGSAV